MDTEKTSETEMITLQSQEKRHLVFWHYVMLDSSRTTEWEKKNVNDQIVFREDFTSNLIMKIKANGVVLIKC